ncbi:Molybdenum cofactor synthesis protein 3, partial [Linderina macrospora]
MSTSERIQEVKARLAVLRAEELELESELVKLTEAGQKEASQAEKKKEHLVPDDIRRYSRQLLIPEIGVHGQLQLQNAKVLIVGTGGLGSPCAMYLASMGIGTLGLIDHDVVDSSNLHRQIIHTEAARNVPKVVSAHNSLSRLNSSCKVSVYDILLDSANALDIMRGYDVVVDATDNAATRYLINDACVMLTIPLVSGSAVRLDGQLTVYNYNGGPCYRCLFPTPPPVETLSNCSETGVLGVVPGIIGCLQAMEAVK